MINKLTHFVLALFYLNMVLALADAEQTRPSEWAQAIEQHGVPNLHKVSDTLYRSAQPSAEGMKNLKAMGVETIVKEPLIKYMMLLAYRLVRDQGMILKACRYLSKNHNAERGQACKPHRARPEAHICRVAKLVKDSGH